MSELPADIAAAIERLTAEASVDPDLVSVSAESRIKIARLALDAAILARLDSAEAISRGERLIRDDHVRIINDLRAQLSAALARGERLEKALKPFAAWMDALEPEFGDHEDDVIAGGVGDAVVRFGDLREARASLGFLVPDEERGHGAS